MLLRPFKEMDTDSVFALFSENAVKDRRRDTGFFDYSMSPDEIRVRSSLNGTLVMEDHGRIIGYGISYLVTDFDSLGKTDKVHARLGNSPSEVLYIDQLCFKPGSPVYLAGQFTSAWEHWLQNLHPMGSVAAIPVEPWMNIASMRFMVIHGFRKYCMVEDDKVTLALLARPNLRVNVPSDVQMHELFGDG